MTRPLFLRQQTLPNPGPSAINFTGTTVDVSAAQGALIGTLSTVNGASPFTYTCSDSKFQISGNQVQRSGTGTLTQGVPESLNFTSTDANSLSTNTATNGQGPFSVNVTAAFIPTGVTTAPSPISIPANTAGNTIIAVLTEVGGTGVSVVFSVTGNANLVVSGSNLMTVASPTFVAGVNQTYSLHVTDTGGTFNDAAPRTLTVQASQAPTGITVTPVSPFPNVLANATAGTVLANLAEIGGTGTSVVFSLVGGSSANLAISGSNLVVHSSPTFTPGSSPTYALSVTDSGGTYSDAAGSRSYSVPAGPSTVTGTLSILDNAVLGVSAGSLTAVGGTAPYVWTIPSGYGGFFNIASPGNSSSLTLNSSGVGNLTPGSLSGNVQAVDAAGLSTGSVSLPITVQNHSASSLVAQIIVANDSGGTIAANSITHTFGHKFKEGDIATSTYPDFRLQDGTLVSYSMSVAARSLFSPTDSSLWDATFMLRMPNSIPGAVTLVCTTTAGSKNVTVTSGNTSSIAQYMGVFGTNISIKPTGVASITDGTHFVLSQNAVKSGSLTLTFNGVLVDIKTNGAGPGTNSRTTADFTAGGLDIKNTAIYQTGGSGTTVCSLAYAAANSRADDYQFMGGAAGSCYVYPTVPYRNGGVSDPLLNGYVTAYTLENAAAGLYGIREVIMPSNGFPDVTGNSYKTFSSVITDDGLGHSFDCYDVTTIGSTRNCNAATIGNNQFVLSGGTSFDGGEYVQVGGSVPSPLVAGNFYFVQKVSSTNFQLSTGSAQGSSRITPTSTGGSWTVTAYPYLVPFGTQSDFGPQARPRFYQGAGTVAADVSLRVYRDPYYARSTGFYPSFDCEGADYQHSGTRPVPSNKTSTYFWGTSQPLGQRSLGGVSPEPTGYDLWSSNDFFNQTPTTQRNSAMSALIGCQFGIRLRSGLVSTRGRCIPVNNTTYTSMPTKQPTMNYGTNAGGVNFPVAGGAPTPISVLCPGFDAQTFDHWFAWFTGAVDTFREPHQIDWMIDDACHAMFERGITTGVNNYSATQWSPGATKICSNAGFGTTRYCINMGSSLQNGRYDAWAWRTQMHGAIRICTGWPEYPYLHDVADAGIANTVEMFTNQATNPLAAATGFWLKGPTNFFFDGWQVAYYGMGMGPAGNYSKFNANALVGVNQTLKHMTNMASIMGFPLGYAQETPITATSGATTGPLIADSSLMAGESLTLSWVNGSSIFTWSSFSTTTLHTQGTYDFTKSTVGSADYFIFTSHSPPSESIKLPGGGTEMVKYYVKPLSSSTCELHRQADFSDPAFQPTDTNSSVTWFRIVDFNSKLVFPAAYNIKDQFYNTMWDAVATALAWGQTGGDATGQALWISSWQAALTAGLLNQGTQGDGPNYLNTTL